MMIIKIIIYKLTPILGQQSNIHVENNIITAVGTLIEHISIIFK